eukprot:2304263-Ditylum_brightwellii.AAC.1
MAVAGKRIKRKKQSKDVINKGEDKKMEEDGKEENAKIDNLKSVADQIKKRGENNIGMEEIKK